MKMVVVVVIVDEYDDGGCGGGHKGGPYRAWCWVVLAVTQHDHVRPHLPPLCVCSRLLFRLHPARPASGHFLLPLFTSLHIKKLHKELY